MNIKINGNVITITSAIPFNALEKVGEITISNEQNKPVYKVACTEIGSICPVGASFTFADTQGNAALNVITDIYDAAELKECFLNSEQESLIALMQYENAVISALNTKAELLSVIENVVEVG